MGNVRQWSLEALGMSGTDQNLRVDNGISHLSMHRRLFYGAKSPKGDVSPNIGSSFFPSFYEWQV